MKPLHWIKFIFAFAFVTSIGLAQPDPDEIFPPVAAYKVSPQHPQELYEQAIEGHATIIATVDMFGSVQNPEVETTTHEEFGLAALLAAAEWIFDPASRNGVPIEVRVKIPFKFSISFEHRLNVELGREVFRRFDTPIIPSSDLNESPSPNFVPALVEFYPEEMHNTGISAAASVEFIISPSGTVHNPRIISISAPGFDEAALRAVSSIRYNPIKIEGEPVYVSMMMPIQMGE